MERAIKIVNEELKALETLLTLVDNDDRKKRTPMTSSRLVGELKALVRVKDRLEAAQKALGRVKDRLEAAQEV